MEKAGGTTLHTILRNNFPTYVSLAPRSSWGEKYEKYFVPKAAKKMFGIIAGPAGFGGHYVAPWMDYKKILERDILYFTFLREPIQRYRSHFEHRLFIDEIPIPSEEFMSNEHYNNFMTYRIAGEPNLEKAIEILDRKFAFTGLVESFDESLLILRHLLKKPEMQLVCKKRNVPPRKEEVKYDWDEDRVKENNALDIALYDHAKKTLFNPLIESYPGDLSKDMKIMQGDYEQGKDFPSLKDKILLSNNRYVQRKLEKWSSRR